MEPSPSVSDTLRPGACLTVGVVGGLHAGTVLGLTEALWVLAGARASEYWALFVGALLYGMIGACIGLLAGIVVLLRIIAGARLTRASAQTFAVCTAISSGVAALSIERLEIKSLDLTMLDFADVGVAVGVTVMVFGVGAWLGPILLTRTPLKALTRAKGALVGWVGVLTLAALFSLAPAQSSAPSVRLSGDGSGASAEADALILVVDGLVPEALERTAFDPWMARAVRFERAYSQAGWRHGALASILTGTTPIRHGVWGPLDGLADDVPTLIDVFAAAGADTTWIEGGTDGARARGLLGGVSTYVRPGAAGIVPESARRLQVVRLAAAHWGAPTQTAEAMLSVENAVVSASQSHRRFAVVAHLADAGDPDGDTTAEEITQSLLRMDERGALEDAVVVLVGTMSNQAHSHELSEQRLAVPLAVRLPRGGLGGASVEWSVRTMDVAPSVLVQAGLPVPVDWVAQDLFEQEIVDFLTGRIPPPPDRTWQAVPDDRVVSVETLARPVVAAQRIDGVSELSFRRQNWKYRRYVGEAGRVREELFDLTSDPLETANLAGPAARQWAEIRSELAHYLRDVERLTELCEQCFGGEARGSECLLLCSQEG